MKKVVVQSPRNSTCETAPLSTLDFSNWVDALDGLQIKAEKGSKYHLVEPKNIYSTLGMRNGTLVWVTE